MSKCKQCNKNEVTQYQGLGMCNPCYYALRPSLALVVPDKISCVRCSKRPARYKISKLCHACNEAMRRERLGHDVVIKRQTAWRSKQSPEWRKQRAIEERERRARLGDEYREKERERNIQRREQRLAYNHAYYKENSEQLREYQSQYRKDHPEWVSEVKRKRRTRAVGLPDTLTEAEWQSILAKWNHACSYCGRQGIPLVKDHATPLSRGGGYTADNIRPACHSCNSRKHTMTADEFIKKIKDAQ